MFRLVCAPSKALLHAEYRNDFRPPFFQKLTFPNLEIGGREASRRRIIVNLRAR